MAIFSNLIPNIRSAARMQNFESRESDTPAPFASIAAVVDSIGGGNSATIWRPHWMSVWAALARQQISFVRNSGASNVPYFGTSGIRADQAITDWLPAALATGADAIIFEPGTNNFDVGGGTTAQAVADQKAQAADAIRAAGKTPIIFDILPVRSDAPDAAARVAWSLDANAKTAIAMASRPWAIYVTWSAGIPVDGSGYVATSSDYIDYLHPQMDGHFKLGAYLNTALSAYVTASDFFSGVTFVSPNPTFTGTSPGTGWTVDDGSGKTVTKSLIARGGSLGNWLQLAMSGTAANNSTVRYGFGTASGGWVAGDVLAHVVEFETDSDISALQVIKPQGYTLIGGDFSQRVFGFQPGSETNTSFQRMASGILLSPWFTSSGSTTQVCPWLDITGTGTIRLGRHGYIKLNP